MKRTTRAFAAGMLFATTTLAIVHYITNEQRQNDAISQKQYEQLITERNELAEKLEKLKKETKRETYIYTLTIAKGEASRDIARRLEQARIIDNAQSFLTYLDTHHLTRALRPGTYVVTSDMSYEQIARNITK